MNSSGLLRTKLWIFIFFSLIIVGVIFFFRKKPTPQAPELNSEMIHQSILFNRAPQKSYSNQACLQCHSQFQPKLTKDVLHSAHGGVQNNCIACHGQAHMEGNQVNVSIERCQTCHQNEVQEFMSGSHGQAAGALDTPLQYHFHSADLTPKQCYECHRIGVAQPWDHRATQCETCHAAHLYEDKTTRSSETCRNCHSGPDHSIYDMWLLSTHGRLWKMTKGEKGASCLECHRQGFHDPSRGVIYRHSEEGVTDEVLRDGRQTYMEQACLKCHDLKMVHDFFVQADQIEEELNDFLDKAQFLIEDLDQKGLLTPLMKDVSPNPRTGKVLELGLWMHADPHYPRIVQIYYQMRRDHLNGARKALFHSDWRSIPSWEQKLKDSYVDILSEYNRIVAQSDQKKVQ